jgi:hypothetical protein
MITACNLQWCPDSRRRKGAERPLSKPKEIDARVVETVVQEQLLKKLSLHACHQA